MLKNEIRESHFRYMVGQSFIYSIRADQSFGVASLLTGRSFQWELTRGFPCETSVPARFAVEGEHFIWESIDTWA